MIDSNPIVAAARARLGNLSLPEVIIMIKIVDDLHNNANLAMSAGLTVERYLEMNRTVLDSMELAAKEAMKEKE